jgi:hypothetical protein
MEKQSFFSTMGKKEGNTGQNRFVVVFVDAIDKSYPPPRTGLSDFAKRPILG